MIDDRLIVIDHGDAFDTVKRQGFQGCDRFELIDVERQGAQDIQLLSVLSLLRTIICIGLDESRLDMPTVRYLQNH